MQKPGPSHVRYVMDSGTATKPAFEVVGPAEIHITGDAIKPELGKIVDTHGDVIQPHNTLMVRINDRAKETLVVSKGMLTLVAIVPAFLTVLIVVGGLLVGYGRNDGATAEKINQMLLNQNSQMKATERIENNQNDLDKRIREVERFIDRTGAQKFLEEK